MTLSTGTRVVRLIARMNTGGPAQHVAHLAAGMTELGYDHHLIYGSIEADEQSMEDLLEGNTGTLHRLSDLRRSIGPFADLRATISIYRYLRKVRPHAVHTHTAKAGLTGRVAAFLARVPVTIHTYHGHVFSGYFGPFETKVYLFLERLLALRTTVLITLSDDLKHELCDDFGIGSEDQYRIIRLGLDLEVYKTDVEGLLKAELGLPEDISLIGSVGRLVPIKDFVLLVKAFARMEDHNAHLVIAGDGDCRPEIQETAESLGVGDRVHLVGWRTDIPNLMRSFDCFALTSLNEGTPVSIIEALSAGTPVVSTAVGGVADLLEHGNLGEVVHSRDPGTVATALDKALKQKTTVDRAQIISMYSKDRLVADVVALLSELCVKQPVIG